MLIHLVPGSRRQWCWPDRAAGDVFYSVLERLFSGVLLGRREPDICTPDTLSQPYAEDIDAGTSDSARQLADFAKNNGVTLVAGSIPEASEGNLYNTCLVFDRRGKQIAKHRKVLAVAIG